MLGHLIEKKKKQKLLTKEDFDFVINCMLQYGCGKSVVKFFLALNSFGMRKEEVLNLALALRDSGEVVEYEDEMFDKHSTGGVGDPSSLVILPLLASAGYKMIKTGGRSLAYTNGSADRFKAIPGLRTDLTQEEILYLLDNANGCFVSHSEAICPADRVLYDIREMCSIEDDINLLAASIACKKLASGAKIILVDVKYGDASIVKSYHEAQKLAKILEYVFNAANVKPIIVISQTEQMIGEGVGNALEVLDAIKVLKGERNLLRDVSIEYATQMILAKDKKADGKYIREMLEANLNNGKAYDTFCNIVKLQGGDETSLVPENMFKPYRLANFVAEKDGYVSRINALLLGELVRRLCEVSHDNNIGVVLRAKIGDYLKKGETVLTFYYKNEEDLKTYRKSVIGCIAVSTKKIEAESIVKKIIK